MEQSILLPGFLLVIVWCGSMMDNLVQNEKGGGNANNLWLSKDRQTETGNYC